MYGFTLDSHEVTNANADTYIYIYIYIYVYIYIYIYILIYLYPAGIRPSRHRAFVPGPRRKGGFVFLVPVESLIPLFRFVNEQSMCVCMCVCA